MTHQTGKCAYVSLVMKGDVYVPGAIVLAHSLRQTGTKHDIVCMVTRDVSEQAIRQLRVVFDSVIPVEYITVDTKIMKNQKVEDIYGSWKSVAYTKWNALNLTQYRKVMFLDADLLVAQNIDGLFELQTPAAAFSIPQAKPFCGRNGLYNPYKTVAHGHPVKHEEIEDGFHSFVCIGTTVVLTPNAHHFTRYVDMVRSMAPFGIETCWNGSDEQSIALFYHRELRVPWTHISQAYNMVPWKQKTWMPRKGDNRVYVLHYVGAVKPWKMRRDEWDDLGPWWKCADDVRACYSQLQGFVSNADTKKPSLRSENEQCAPVNTSA